jgi:hypothetical protein
LAGSHACLLLHSQLGLNKDATVINRLWLTWFLAIVFFIVMGLFLSAHAAPVAQANGPGGEVITITDEPCKLTDIVDMPHRATWTEKGKTFEGCAAPHPAGVVVLYFKDDKSIALVPIRMFQPLRSM